MWFCFNEPQNCFQKKKKNMTCRSLSTLILLVIEISGYNSKIKKLTLAHIALNFCWSERLYITFNVQEYTCWYLQNCEIYWSTKLIVNDYYWIYNI